MHVYRFNIKITHWLFSVILAVGNIGQSHMKRSVLKTETEVLNQPSLKVYLLENISN